MNSPVLPVHKFTDKIPLKPRTLQRSGHLLGRSAGLAASETQLLVHDASQVRVHGRNSLFAEDKLLDPVI